MLAGGVKKTSRAPQVLVFDDGTEALLVIGAGGVAPTPAAAVAGEIKGARFAVDIAAAALDGEYPYGVTLLNAEPPGGKTIYFGEDDVDATNGFPLEPGASIDRVRWQDLSLVWAFASDDDAVLCVLPL
jgi:hypothetical protein